MKLELQSLMSCCHVGGRSQEHKNRNLWCLPCHQKRALDPHHVVSGNSRNSISSVLIVFIVLPACLHLVREWAPPTLLLCVSMPVTSWIARVPATYACLRCSRQPWLWLGERVRVVPLEGPGQRLCGFPARGLTASGTAVTRSESRTDSKARENPCLTKQIKKKNK